MIVLYQILVIFGHSDFRFDTGDDVCAYGAGDCSNKEQLPLVVHFVGATGSTVAYPGVIWAFEHPPWRPLAAQCTRTATQNP